MMYFAKRLLGTFLVFFSVIGFYGLASDLVDTLSISSKPLDTIIADGSIFRYRIHYANNSADAVGNTQVSLYTPRGLHFLTGSVPYDSVQANLDSYKLGVPGDICYEQFMNETGIYVELIDQWAQGRYGMDAYDVLFLMPYTPAFSSAPYNGERSMFGEYFVEVVLPLVFPSLPKEKSFQSFITKTLEVDDFNTLTGCGLGLKTKTKYTRDLGSLTAGAGGDITVVLQADDPRRDDIIPLDVIEGTNIDTPMNLSLPIDVNTLNYPVSVSYTNATDGGISFWPNNPNYPATYSNISMVSGLLNDSMSDQEKAIALWQFVKDTTFNYPYPQEHTWYTSAWFAGDEFVNPIYFLNSLYGMCGEINGTLVNLAKVAGLDAHLISLNGHVISEIQIGTGRGMFDADGGVYWTGDDGHVYGVEELAANPDIMLNNPQDNNYEITGYADMIVNRLYDPGLPSLSTGDREKQLFTFLQPNDTITYEYRRHIKELDGSSNNGYVDDGVGSLTSRLASNVYTTVSGQEFGIISQTEGGFMYANEVPYRITSLDISLDDPTDKNIQVYVNINGDLDWHLIGKLTHRVTYDVANFHKYVLRFDCSDCVGNDIDNIVSQLQIKNNFIFNSRMLPYSGALNIYDTFLSDNVGTGITVSFNKNIDSPVRFSISITGDQAEDVLLNNNQSVEIIPLQDYAPALLPSDPTYAREVLEWKGYTGNATSFFDDLPADTLVGTSAISFLNTGIIPENIIIRSDDVEAFLPADTVVTPSGTTCPASTLLAPIDVTADYTGADFSGVVKAFKVGSPCAGTTLHFSPSVTMRIHTDEIITGTIVVRISSDGETNRQDLTGTKIDDHTVEVSTDHFSYFTIETLGTGANGGTGDNGTGDNGTGDNGGGDNGGDNGGITGSVSTGGNPTLRKDVCLNGDLSPSFYDGICTASCTAYSNELNAAYGFARDNGITTFKDCRQANLEGPLFRSHMAKMIVQFAVKVLHKTPDTTRACVFTDIQGQSPELQAYIKLACQLGLMGLKADGTLDDTFNPRQTVDRAQFGTLLSRLLRGEKYNGGENYYQAHLQALQEAGIMNNIDMPFALELRGRVMLMLQRIFEQQQ